MSYEFTDPFLVRRVTPERIAAAEADVGALFDSARLSAFWHDKLVVLRAYVIAARENQSEANDLYSEKLKHYQREYEQALSSARAELARADAEAGRAVFMHAVPILRG